MRCKNFKVQNLTPLIILVLFIAFIYFQYIVIVSKVNENPRKHVRVQRKATIVIGIISESSHFCLREAQRKLFVPQARAYNSLNIKVFFLIDHPTPELEKEQRVNNDIFFLNSTVHGWNKSFGKKLHTWFKFAVASFPDAILFSRMDDDAFVCTPQVFDRLNQIKSPFLYYGYPTGSLEKCPTQDCVDDMFIFVGVELVKRVSSRNFCEEKLEENCLYDGDSPIVIRKWISIYIDEIHFVNEKHTGNFVYFYGPGLVGTSEMENMYKKYKTDFCKKHLLFHKSRPSYIYEMNRDNGIQLRDSSRSQITEQDIRNADNCTAGKHF